MDKENPIDYIIKKDIVNKIINNIGVQSDLKDDLSQEIYLILLEYDKDKLQEMINNKQINFFVSRIITNQYNSKTSVFFKKFKKPMLNKLKTIDDILHDEEGTEEE